jgi:two-component system sensor histidine kinase ResE
MLSHDIRNPLHIIFNYADMIADEPELSAGVRLLLQRIKDNAASTVGLVNNFIEVSRIEAGKLALERRPLCFSSLMREVADRQAPLAKAKGVKLKLERTDDHSDVLVDRTSMERALTNLVSNAIKFTPAGGAVHLQLERRGDELLMSVTDTGRGIPEEDIPVIFEKYRRARETTLTEGSGLGLFIVKAIVEAHGGSMDVQSTVGRGSTFTMHLPVAAVEHAPTPQLRSA